jgi:hypothetical protein
MLRVAFYSALLGGSENMKPMMLVLTAVLSGAFLYLSSAAALILFGHAGLFQIGLMAVFLVAIGHASLGFRAIGGRTAWRAGYKKAAAVCALASVSITGLALGGAIFIALSFPLMASPSAAMGIVGACAVAGILGFGLSLPTGSPERRGQASTHR